MNEAQVRTLEQVRQEFPRAEDDEGRCGWIESVLRRFDYRQLQRPERGPVLAYLQRLGGYSRAHETRLSRAGRVASRWSFIEQMLAQFPFEILGFHADNGSEYVSHRVAELLDKLHIEFTRSRQRRSNDDGLAETNIPGLACWPPSLVSAAQAPGWAWADPRTGPSSPPPCRVRLASSCPKTSRLRANSRAAEKNSHSLSS